MPIKASPAAPLATAPSWTGFYLGANVGYGWSNTAVQIAGTPPFDAFVGPAIDPTIASDPNATSLTHAPGSPSIRVNAVVTRTSPSS